jgi:hypothetical protein
MKSLLGSGYASLPNADSKWSEDGSDASLCDSEQIKAERKYFYRCIIILVAGLATGFATGFALATTLFRQHIDLTHEVCPEGGATNVATYPVWRQ